MTTPGWLDTLKSSSNRRILTPRFAAASRREASKCPLASFCQMKYWTSSVLTASSVSASLASIASRFRSRSQCAVSAGPSAASIRAAKSFSGPLSRRRQCALFSKRRPLGKQGARTERGGGDRADKGPTPHARCASPADRQESPCAACESAPACEGMCSLLRLDAVRQRDFRREAAPLRAANASPRCIYYRDEAQRE